MPWYFRRYNPWRRRRWPKRRRTRRAFRRRYTRRRVRHFTKKLKKITLQQWQPPSIRKCKIKGLMCLILANESRLGWNYTMYENSIVPKAIPGGGGFAVMQFTLQNLYDMHQKCTNWWTTGNEDMPLCRYFGCTIRAYQSETVDYILAYDTSYPTNSNKLSYPSCQPSMLMMHKNKLMIPSRRTHPWKKPYKNIKIHPPQQFQTKWYFTRDFCTKPLVKLMSSIASFQHYYTATNWESNNITIKHLNTQLINNTNFQNNTHSWNFKQEGTIKMYFYWYTGQKHPNSTQEFEIKNLIPLTQAKKYSQGADLAESKETFEQYKKDHHRWWGNPFIEEYIRDYENIYMSTTSPESLINSWTQENQLIKNLAQGQAAHGMQLTQNHSPLILETRYNPNLDKGNTTTMWLHANNKNQFNWDPPTDPTMTLTGFPLWLNTFGFIDFQQKTEKYQSITQNYMLAFKTTATTPQYTHTFIPIDENFQHNKSPYMNYVEHTDINKWYPQVEYQLESINNIIKCGPGSAKLEPRTSEEVKIEYKFYFNWGGSPARMVTVNNPTTQAVYPIPNNEHETTSLQSPTQAFETMLYSFDERYNQLTKSALTRIQQDWDIKSLLYSITEPTKEVPAEQTLQTLINQTQTEEKEEETLFQQLLNQRQQQRSIKLRILNLLTNLQKLE
nr:MAG: ORF1 [TTV-like mini virus]